MSIDLSTTYLGMPLAGPVIASAGPLTGYLDGLVALEEAGAAAVVLPSLFEEEVVAEEMAFHDALAAGDGIAPEFTSVLPEIDMPDLGADRHLSRVESAKGALGIPVIASVNATHTGSWSRYATLLADAGADAIELNLYAVAADPTQSAGDVEARYLDVVREVKSAISVPLAVKLSPFHSSMAHFAAGVVEAGADGLVLFNRFYAPDLDLESLEVVPKVSLSHVSEMRLPMRWTGILRSQLPETSLALTSGVHTGADVVKALAVGATVACTTSAVVRDGAGALRRMIDGMVSWMTEREYDSVAQLRGSVSATSAADPSAYERSQYIQIITSLGRR